MIALSHAPLAVERVVAAVADPAHGGLGCFVGSTRAEPGPMPLVALHYEAYEVLARDELRHIAERLSREHGARIAIVHRLGRVAVGEVAVVVAASAPHRAEALAACSAAVEALKADVPIWKRTIRADGSGDWVGGPEMGAVTVPR